MSIVKVITSLILAAAVRPAVAFWRLPCKSTLVVERADPIVNPGNISGHVHQILGGNGFDFEMDYADTQASTCTSCTVHGDFSNYWTPVLYYQHQDGSFEKVNQMGGGLVYYLQRGGPDNDKLQAFPEGFRMLSGDPFKRSPSNDFASQAVSYNCLNYKGGAPETGGFPKNNCPDGLRSQVFFPSCWDGVNNDSPDHKSHVVFPIGAYNNGKCPSTHPVHLVSIFYEILWDTNKFKDMWYGNDQPFVWASGDPTGYGFHGDFLMGWDRKILQSAIDTCTSDSGKVEDCPVFQLYPDDVATGCKLPSKIAEDVQGPFAKLPGCNPVQKGPDRAQVIKTCDGNNATIGAAKPFFTDLTSSGWGYQGCGTDSINARALTGASTSAKSMTNQQCIKFCGDKGFSIAGSQYGAECYCGNSIPTSAQPVPGLVGNCDMACAGDATQLCGGAARLTLYQKCTGTSCSNAAGLPGNKPASYSSVSISATTSKSATSNINQQINTQPYTTTAVMMTATSFFAWGPTSVSSSTKLTTTTLAAPAIPSATTTTAIKSTTTVPVSTSNTAKSSAPTNAVSGLASKWSYVGCRSDTINPRTLPNLAPYTLDGKLMTSTSCVSYCSSRGYAYAGTEYAGECFCANTLSSGSATINESKCDMACKGDATQKCGGSAALSLYADSTKINRTSAKRDEVESPFDLTKAHMKRHEHRRYARIS